MMPDGLQVHCAVDPSLPLPVQSLAYAAADGAVLGGRPRALLAAAGGVLVATSRSIGLLRPAPQLALAATLADGGHFLLASRLLRAGQGGPLAGPDTPRTELIEATAGLEQLHRRLGASLLESGDVPLAAWHFARSDARPSQLLALLPDLAPREFTPSADVPLLPAHTTIRALLLSRAEARGGVIGGGGGEAALSRAKRALLGCVASICDRLDPIEQRTCPRRVWEQTAPLALARQLELGEGLVLLASLELQTGHADALLSARRVHCALSHCAAPLQHAGRHLSYARLLMHAGRPEAALETWAQLGRGVRTPITRSPVSATQPPFQRGRHCTSRTPTRSDRRSTASRVPRART